MNEKTNVATLADLKAAEQPQYPVLADTATEVAASGAAATAKALVEARYIMAMKRPRDWDRVEQVILRECKRPAFARNTSALYHKPIGDGIEGLGIRFVEMALSRMGNVLAEARMVYADAQREVHHVSVTDLESNTVWEIDVVVERTVERSKPADDGSYISVRLNSKGRKVYTVLANDDDILNKRNAIISKAYRTLGLRIIPGHIQDQAESTIREVRTNDAAQDPDAERRRIIAGFDEMNVPADELRKYVGHDLGTCSPQELVRLRGLWGAIKAGETTWAEAVENAAERAADRAPAPKAEAKPATDPQGAANVVQQESAQANEQVQATVRKARKGTGSLE